MEYILWQLNVYNDIFVPENLILLLYFSKLKVNLNKNIGNFIFINENCIGNN